MAKMTKPASDAVEVLHRRFYEGKPSRLKKLEEERANEEIARKIREKKRSSNAHEPVAKRSVPKNLRFKTRHCTHVT
jgi:hypothetical protein